MAVSAHTDTGCWPPVKGAAVATADVAVYAHTRTGCWPPEKGAAVAMADVVMRVPALTPQDKTGKECVTAPVCNTIQEARDSAVHFV